MDDVGDNDDDDDDDFDDDDLHVDGWSSLRHSCCSPAS